MKNSNFRRMNSTRQQHQADHEQAYCL